jgi:hypothetical protein
MSAVGGRISVEVDESPSRPVTSERAGYTVKITV